MGQPSLLRACQRSPSTFPRPTVCLIVNVLSLKSFGTSISVISTIEFAPYASTTFKKFFVLLLLNLWASLNIKETKAFLSNFIWILCIIFDIINATSIQLI